MQNKPLKTIFHIDENLVDEIYKSRFYAPYTQKLGIYTKKILVIILMKCSLVLPLK